MEADTIGIARELDAFLERRWRVFALPGDEVDRIVWDASSEYLVKMPRGLLDRVLRAGLGSNMSLADAGKASMDYGKVRG